MQGWEFAHLLISLKSIERLWAIRSDRSRQMSDCEQIAQVAHIKRATVSESLRLLMTNELNVSDSLRSLTKNEWITPSFRFSPKTSDSLRKPMSEFPALQKCNNFL